LNPKLQQVIQSIKRLDCSLVSSKNFYHLTVSAQGQAKWAKVA